MSENESHHHGKNEIIIIKRHGHGDHGHHGGAWKIAYADFMTAMMAFFLVMWLVNAANDATKAAVASYFNPIKLTDSSPADKGITKPGKQAQGEATQDKSKVDGEEKVAVEASLARLKDALGQAEPDTEALKSGVEDLMTTSQAFAQKLYEQAATENAGQYDQAGSGATGADDDEVVDAEVIDEDEAK